MAAPMTRRRFMAQTVGMIGGTMVAGDLFPLLAEAAKRKQILRVAIERDIETLRPELSSGDTVNLLRRRQCLAEQQRIFQTCARSLASKSHHTPAPVGGGWA